MQTVKKTGASKEQCNMIARAKNAVATGDKVYVTVKDRGQYHVYLLQALPKALRKNIVEDPR